MTSENKAAVFGPWMVGTGIDDSAADDWEMPVHEGRTSSSCRSIIDDGGEVVAFAVASYNEWDNPTKEAQLSNNARLIAEAGTVFHECGLSPRELLEAVRDMRSLLEQGTAHIKELCMCYSHPLPEATMGAIYDALAKHKEV